MKFILSPILKMLGIPLFWLLLPLWYYKGKYVWGDAGGFILLNLSYVFYDPYSFFEEFDSVGDFLEYCGINLFGKDDPVDKYSTMTDAQLKNKYYELSKFSEKELDIDLSK